jgi:AcrR family transcriptional regulator
LPPLDTPKPGLRELKKARTRTAIQHEALRLFQRQGYAATTIEQIAAAAEVSQSTFFRYFPTKEDVVLWDDYDPRFMAALREQPKELAPIPALRGAMRSVFAQLTVEEVDLERQRGALINTEPELRARSIGATLGSVGMLADVIAERVGRDPGDFAVRNLVGAVVGTMFTAWLAISEQEGADVVGAMDAALEHLDRGLPL